MIIRKKTWTKIFEDVLSGKKKFDLRLADFDIKEGDTLILEEWNPEIKEYTGRKLEKKVGYILKFDYLIPRGVRTRTRGVSFSEGAGT